MSRRHARLLVTRATLVVEDLDSKNGTHVNGKRVDKATPVANGDEILFGSVRTTVEIARAVDPSTLTI